MWWLNLTNTGWDFFTCTFSTLWCCSLWPLPVQSNRRWLLYVSLLFLSVYSEVDSTLSLLLCVHMSSRVAEISPLQFTLSQYQWVKHNRSSLRPPCYNYYFSSPKPNALFIPENQLRDLDKWGKLQTIIHFSWHLTLYLNTHIYSRERVECNIVY